jgi:hypothetical protein
MLLFLQGLPAAAEHDHSRIAARVLNTHSLGEYVAPHWRLQDVMRWVPPRAGELGLDGRASGLHKIAGTMVEAVVGGVFHQFVSLISCPFHPTNARAYRPSREGASLTGFSILGCFRIYYNRDHHSGYLMSFTVTH